jgi:hypothetical protein
MTFRPTTLERAYQLAASGDCKGKVAIVSALNAEGYHFVRENLEGRSITTALRELCQKNYREPVAA